MDTEALRTFVAIHRAGGVTRAAETLFVSQPAVSRRLAMLEQDLGAPLFERVAGGVVLSEAGKTLLPLAERALGLLSDAEAAVRALHSDDRGTVSIALVGTLAGTNLTPVLKRFADQHPRVDLDLRTATSREVSDLVRRAEVTLGLRYSEDSSPELECRTLYSERMVVVASPDHPRAAAGPESFAELRSERWIAFPDVAGRPEAAARYVRLAFDAAGVDESEVLRIDSLTAQKRLVEAGFGIAMVPESSVEEEVRAGSLAVLEVQGLDVAVPVVLVTRRGGYLGAAARTLIGELEASVETLAKGRDAASRRGG